MVFRSVHDISTYGKQCTLIFVVENKVFGFFACRGSHLVTGTAFIVVANFVGQLVEVQIKGMTMMIVLCLCYSHAICARKNVFPVHTYILLLIRYSFLKMRCFISLLEMNSNFYPLQTTDPVLREMVPSLMIPETPSFVETNVKRYDLFFHVLES